jgi:hypothetical protein
LFWSFFYILCVLYELAGYVELGMNIFFFTGNMIYWKRLF